MFRWASVVFACHRGKPSRRCVRSKKAESKHIGRSFGHFRRRGRSYWNRHVPAATASILLVIFVACYVVMDFGDIHGQLFPWGHGALQFVCPLALPSILESHRMLHRWSWSWWKELTRSAEWSKLDNYRSNQWKYVQLALSWVFPSNSCTKWAAELAEGSGEMWCSL